MSLIFRQIASFAWSMSTLLAVVGCSRMGEVGFDTQMALGSVSMVDRCSDFMRRAFPNGAIDVVDGHVNTSMETALVTVQGARNGVPENSRYARSVAVECRFEGGVLTGFRWIAGPIRAATSGEAL